ncbi:hypothetical protein ACTFIY_011929 [Dictyostelium cf. discoideum]
MQCFHEEFSIEKALKLGYQLREKLSVVNNWPMYFSGECTIECKVKMKKVYEIVYGDFISKINDFFDDAFLIPGAENISIVDHIGYLLGYPWFRVEQFTSRVEPRFNIGYVNGVPKRLDNFEQRQQYYIQHRQDPIPLENPIYHKRQFECFHKTFTIENAKNMGLHLRGNYIFI